MVAPSTTIIEPLAWAREGDLLATAVTAAGVREAGHHR